MILASMFDSFNNAFTDMVFASVGVTQKLGLVGMLLFILVEIGMTILRFFNGGGESQLSFQRPLSFIVLFFFLLSYVPVMKTFDSLITGIEGYVRAQGETDYLTVASDLIQMKNVEHAADLKKAGDDAGALRKVYTDMQNSFAKVGTFFKSTIENLTFSLPALLFASIADGLTGIIRYLVEVLSVLLAGVLIVVGPLAAMFETAPFIGEGILKNWFSNWLSIKCWTITMSIIDMMMHKFLILYTSQQHTLDEYFLIGGTGTLLMVINTSFIILFIMTPMLTNYYVKGSGGAFFSKIISAATTVAHVSSGGATLGAAGATKAFESSVGALTEKMDALKQKLNSTKP